MVPDARCCIRDRVSPGVTPDAFDTSASQGGIAMELAKSDPWEEGSVRVTAVDDSSSWDGRD